MGERGAALVGDGDRVALEHLGEQLGVRADEDRDVLGGHAVAQELQDRRSDELGLGALAAGLEQPDGAVGCHLRRVGLEQRALEVVERAAGARRVVLGAGLEQHVLARERLEQLDRRRAAGERGAARLVRERDGDGGVGVADERLDQVELGGRQVVEAVQQQRPPVPGLPQPVQGRAGEPVGIDRAERLEAPVVGGVQGGELAGVRRRGPGLAPGADRRAEPSRRSERALKLREQVAERVRETRAGGRGGERAQLDVGDRGAHHPPPREPPERAPADAGHPRDVRDQTRERRDLGAEHDAGAGELAGVVLGVGRRRDDEHGPTRQRGAQALEHGARLGGVGRTGDQRQRHERLHRVARGPAGMTAPVLWTNIRQRATLRVATLRSSPTSPLRRH